jgi:hypothetical protein
MTGPPADPIRARRELYRRAANLGQRIGYLLYGLAIAAFLVGFVVDFTPATVTLTVAALAVGSIVLLPAIIAGYAVRAADREDAELGRERDADT